MLARIRESGPAGRLWPRRAAVQPIVLLGALTAAVAFLLARVVDLAQIRSSAARLVLQPELLGAFLVTYTAAFWLRAIAWRQLLPSAPGVLPLFGILQAALFANHILPLKAGEVVRPYLLTRRGVGALMATTTTVVARLLDFLVLLILAGVLLPLTADSLWPSLRILALPIVVVSAGCAVLVWLRASSSGMAVLGPLARAVRAAGGSLRAIAPRRIARAAAWTAPSWMLEGATVLIAAQTMGITLTVPAAVAVTAVTILFQLVHLTPGGLGVYEASMAGALALYGLPLEQGVTLAVVAHGMKFAYALVIGGVCAAWAARGVMRSNAA